MTVIFSSSQLPFSQKGKRVIGMDEWKLRDAARKAAEVPLPPDIAAKVTEIVAEINLAKAKGAPGAFDLHTKAIRKGIQSLNLIAIWSMLEIN